jgi:hypothetical protein
LDVGGVRPAVPKTTSVSSSTAANSGHPLWMKNYAIPGMKRARARMEKTLHQIAARRKVKRSQKRRSANG